MLALRSHWVLILAFLSAVAASPGSARAQQPETGTEAPEVEMPQVVDGKITVEGVEYQVGPCQGDLGQEAAIEVPDGLWFTGRQGTVRFLQNSQNLSGENEVGIVLDPVEGWWVCFTLEKSGHVKDDDKDDLDADALLDAIRGGVEQGNEARKRRGWGTIELVGWHKPPFYDAKTNNLTWSTLIGGTGGQSVNWSTRLLGRTSTMNVDLVASVEQVDAVMPRFEELIRGHAFKEGHTYGEFKSGDKVAEYGLAALVAGGAGVVAAKTGLLAKLWKPIALGLVAIGAFFKRIFGFGKKNPDESAAS